MGHQRLGRLPKTRRWQQVVELLDTGPEDTAGIAAAVVLAADRRLRDLAGDPSPTYCFWLLTRIAWASRGQDFAGDLAKLGIEAADGASVLTFISQVADRVRDELSPHTSSGHFTELASLALRRALSRRSDRTAQDVCCLSSGQRSSPAGRLPRHGLDIENAQRR